MILQDTQSYVDNVLALIPFHRIGTCTLRLVRDSHRIDIPRCPHDIHVFLSNIPILRTTARNHEHP
jgi:hypothetical protein